MSVDDLCIECGQPFPPRRIRGRNSKVYCSRACLNRAAYERQMSSPQRAQRRRAYNRWLSMVNRCQDPKNVRWSRYGGRGIYVVERWLDFETYYADVGDPPEGMTLDRIDNDGPYSPENTRWATPSQQRVNQEVRTHCFNGHAFDEANTYLTRSGSRACRACRRERDAKKREASRNVA